MSPLLRVCPAPGCGRLTSGGRCDQHRLEQQRRGDRRRHARQKTSGRSRSSWQRLRAARLALDGCRCRLALPGCAGLATSVHLDPALAGDHDAASLDDLVSACAHCHGVIDGRRSSGGVSRRTAVVCAPARQPHARFVHQTSVALGEAVGQYLPRKPVAASV